MRMSQLFTLTLREAPAGVELPGYALLLRAGYARPLSAGVLAALPLGARAAERLEGFARAILDLTGAQPIELPLVTPSELSGAGSTAFEDAAGRSLALPASPLPALLELLREQIRSHRQLPALLAAVGPSWRDDARLRGGWLNARYDRTLSAFWLFPDDEAQSAGMERLQVALQELFKQLGLPARPVEAGPGETRWFYPHPAGDETILSCPSCGYAAEGSWAAFARETSLEAPLPLEKVATPHCPTIDALAQFLGVPAARTAKAVFLSADLPSGPQTVFAVVRGDRDLSEPKLMRLLGARGLRPASEAEIIALGAVPGYASPVGLKEAWVIVDEEIPGSPSLVSGANEEGYHLKNVTYGRDYTARQVADIAAARPGEPCPRCGGALVDERGAFMAGAARPEVLPGLDYQDESGQICPVRLLAAEIGLYRLLGALAEQRHDERGLAWPRQAAPFDLHLVLLASKSGAPEAQAAELYERLQAAGWQVLFDDRAESAGVKFNDADLIGLPLRLTVSERSLRQGGVELKARLDPAPMLAPVEALEEKVRELLAR